MEPKEKKAFEPSGLVPRSIVRTFERFRQQLLPGSEAVAIREYRISRYQVLVSARCLFTLLTIPIATNWLVSSWLLSPLIEHFWNTQQNEIFLNSYQEERAFAELEFFSEKLFFESLLNTNNSEDFCFSAFGLRNNPSNPPSLDALSRKQSNFFKMNALLPFPMEKVMDRKQPSLSSFLRNHAPSFAPKERNLSFAGKGTNEASKCCQAKQVVDNEPILFTTVSSTMSQQFTQYRDVDSAILYANSLFGYPRLTKIGFAPYPWYAENQDTSSANSLICKAKEVDSVDFSAYPRFDESQQATVFTDFSATGDLRGMQSSPLFEETLRGSGSISWDINNAAVINSFIPCMPCEAPLASNLSHQAFFLTKECVPSMHSVRRIGSTPSEPCFRMLSFQEDILSKDRCNVLAQRSRGTKELIDSVQIKEKVQEKIFELAVYYNQQTILSITNVAGDLVSILTLGCLFVWMKPEITILKSFLIEAIYSLSDTTKSFLLILLTDLLVGFHSPRGWETALELLLKHVGLPENQDFVFLFVATFPVLLDTVFKYWIFRHLNKISPSTVATYHSMIE